LFFIYSSCGYANSLSYGDLVIPDQSGKVITVNGPIEPSQLGATLMHEHLLVDLRHGRKKNNLKEEPKREKFSLYSRSQTYTVGDLDSSYVHNVKDAVKEVTLYKNLGGKSIVDVSTINMNRKPYSIQKIAQATNVNIVMATGFYHSSYHPDDMDQRSLDNLVATMVDEIVNGINGSDIKAGIIGEVGVHDFTLTPVESNDVRSLRASARASQLTGAAISLHGNPYRPEIWHAILDILEEEGADLSRVIIGHVGAIAAKDIIFLEGLLARGVYLQFDLLGWPPAPLMPIVDQRPMLEGIVNLIKNGHSKKILVSQDAFTKAHKAKNGGWGMTFVHTALLPYLRDKGVTGTDIKNILESNPRRILTFLEPRII